jgi:hypothetical protein
MIFKGRVEKIDLDYISHKPKITLQLSSQYDLLSEEFNKLQSLEEISIELKEYKEKRSLNSNGYAWVLITKIADVLRNSKEEVYLEMLKRYGQSEIVSVLSSIDVTGYFKYYEVAGTSTLNSKEFTHYKVYKGSSEYDTREMSILIDGIVSEAKELGIETLPPEEIENLKNMWRA